MTFKKFLITDKALTGLFASVSKYSQLETALNEVLCMQDRPVRVWYLKMSSGSIPRYKEIK